MLELIEDTCSDIAFARHLRVILDKVKEIDVLRAVLGAESRLLR